MIKISFIKTGLLTVFFITALYLAACTKPPLTVKYYNITADVTHSDKRTSLPSILLIGAIRLNSFLDQGPIVKQRSPHSATLLEQHHWAGNLDAMLLQNLIQNLILELGSEKIYSYPDTSSDSGIRLTVNFYHFEEDDGGKAFLQARWQIISNVDQSILYSTTSTKNKIPESSAYNDLAKALSQCLAELSHEIADRILQIQSPIQSTKES